jgi:hypothetical protein
MKFLPAPQLPPRWSFDGRLSSNRKAAGNEAAATEAAAAT